jgi:hypothetical protein
VLLGCLRTKLEVGRATPPVAACRFASACLFQSRLRPCSVSTPRTTNTYHSIQAFQVERNIGIVLEFSYSLAVFHRHLVRADIEMGSMRP